jgi:hypothetical protein
MDNKDIKKTLEKISNTIAKPDGVEYVYIHQIKSPSEHDYISYVFVVPDDTELLDDKTKLSKLMRRWQENILKYYNLYIGEHLNVIQSQTIRKGDFERLGTLRNKKKQNESINDTEISHSPEERKLKLIQKYLDNVLTPRNELIHDAKVYRLTNRDEYAITIWVNTERALNRDEYDGLVDDTWDEIVNMFDVPVSIRRIPMNR